MTMLLDTHHHFDFLAPVLRRPFLAALGDVSIVAQTLTPSGFWELERTEDAPARCAVGFHPWYVAEDLSALDAFEAALQWTRFVGEVGLDFSPRRTATVSAGLQLKVLRRLLTLVRRADSRGGPYVLSIHAVRAASPVMDLLEEICATADSVVPVFHRFAGTSDELTRLIRFGGHISVHPQLLATKRGRAYVQQVPADRLLLETDLPPNPIAAAVDARPEDVAAAAANEVRDALTRTLRELSERRGCDMTATVQLTQSQLYCVG